jgi:predicted HTH transcriptional regulator
MTGDRGFSPKEDSSNRAIRGKADDIFKVTQKVGTVNPVNSESLALQIIANIKADPFISYEELSEVLGIPRRTLARRMNDLSKAGSTRRIGAAKNGHWEVNML